MKPFHVFADTERSSLEKAFAGISTSPYRDYAGFKREVLGIVHEGAIPGSFVALCRDIAADRADGNNAHVLRNCPVDSEIPDLNHENPVADKYRLKRTFVGEAFLEVFAHLMGNPLLSYKTRNNGDFFTDVVAIKRFGGKRSGYTDGDLVYHNDRTCHKVRADFVTLLGLRCPSDDLVYTSYIDGKEIFVQLSEEHLRLLGEKWFFTEVDDLTKESNRSWEKSETHEIVLADRSIRFQDTLTKPIPSAPAAVRDALLEFKDAITKANKSRHRLENRDLLVFANQHGLHNRERIEVNNPDETAKRWLLKTYTFKDPATAEAHRAHWADDVYGCVRD